MIPVIFAGTSMDPTSSSVISLIGSLGSAGAAVVVVWFFLSYLKAESTARDQRWEQLAERYADVIKDNSDAMRQFSTSVNTICRITSNGGPPR